MYVKRVPELADSFTKVHPAFFTIKNPAPPKSNRLTDPDTDFARLQLTHEYEWLEKVCISQIFDGKAKITWLAHHASMK